MFGYINTLKEFDWRTNRFKGTKNKKGGVKKL